MFSPECMSEVLSAETAMSVRLFVGSEWETLKQNSRFSVKMFRCFIASSFNVWDRGTREKWTINITW